jgi:hypothetical protein
MVELKFWYLGASRPGKNWLFIDEIEASTDGKVDESHHGRAMPHADGNGLSPHCLWAALAARAAPVSRSRN